MSKRTRKHNTYKGARRTGLFIGGVLYGLIRGIFFRNNY